jgi:succinyl-diaminopimelate desuccinylase
VRRVAELFRQRGQRLDACLVGEPSSSSRLGDVVRIGRRGSLTATIRVHGVQGHVAYPEQADNPIHRALPALLALCARRWDAEPFPDFPPTSFQIANLHAGTGAANVIPGEAVVQCNFRYSPRWSSDALVAETVRILSEHGVAADIHWHRSGEPFHTADGALRRALRATLLDTLGSLPDENTGGGTSDGRFIAPLGAEVVELGPLNASIHKVDECIALADLEILPRLYAGIACRYFGWPNPV